VFICCPVQVLDPCNDDDFGITTDQPYLKRYIEQYCWREVTQKHNGNLHFSYKSAWSPSFVDSSGFKNKNYRNTKSTHTDKTFTSTKAMMGAYRLNMLSMY
jgi:hypothetical protein